MKENKKTFVIIIAFMFVCVIGFLAYRTKSLVSGITVTVDNGEISPKFSLEITEYEVHINDDETILKCGFKADGCYEKIKLINGHADKIITYNDIEYKFAIINNSSEELTDNNTTLKINSVKGVPLSWTKEATITVEAENYKNKDDLLYSFDNGQTWQKENSKTLTNPEVLDILVKEEDELSAPKKVEVEKVDSTEPEIKITASKNEAGEVILSVVGGDDTSSINSFTWNNEVKGDSIKITNPGTYTVQAKDVAGNIKEETITIDNVDDIETEPDIYIMFFPNGANGSTKTIGCELNPENDMCDITMPSITRTGYTVLGWSEDPNATKAQYKPGDSIYISESKKFYAITKRTVTLSFKIKDTKRAKIASGKTSYSCSYFNKQNGCYIILEDDATSVFPKVEGENGYIFDGWNTNPNAKNAITDYKDISPLTKNVTYYDVTHKNVYVYFDSSNTKLKSGSTLVYVRKDGFDESTRQYETCTVYNSETQCEVSIPGTHLMSKDYKILGWSSYPNSHEATTGVTGKLNVNAMYSSTQTYYVVVQRRNPYTATFIVQNYKGLSGSHSQINNSAKARKCYIYNNENECDVDAPILEPYKHPNNIYSYSFIGWNTNPNAQKSSVSEKIHLSGDMTYYSITSKNIETTFKISDTTAFENANSEYKYSCSIYNNFDENSECSVNTPSVKKAKNYEFVGWTATSGSTQKLFDGSKAPSSSRNKIYYSISYTKRNIKFELIDKSNLYITYNGGQRKNELTLSCDEYNSSGKCKLKVPWIAYSSGKIKVLGWGESNSESAIITSSNNEQEIKIRNYYSVTYDETPLTASFNIDSSIGNLKGDNTKCYKYNGAKGCKITSPIIEIIDNRYTALGWNTKKDQTTSTLDQNKTIQIEKNVTYYPVLKFNGTKKVSITYEMNDSYALQTGASVPSSHICTLGSNGQCPNKLTLPTTLPLKSGYEFVGWSDTKNATTPSVKKGNSIVVSENKKYYAITRKKIDIKYEVLNSNAATISISDSQAFSIKNNVASYYLYNGERKNAIIANLTPKTGYMVFGWSTAKNSHTKNKNPNDTITLSKDTSSTINYYSVTGNISIKATFNYPSGEFAKYAVLSSDTPFNQSPCVVYNNETYCYADVPKLVLTAEGKSKGLTIIGWNRNPSAVNSEVQNGQVKINNPTKDVAFYAIFRTDLTINYTVLDSKAFSSNTNIPSETTLLYNSFSTTVTLPTLTPKSGYEFLGWSTGNNSKTAEYKGGQKVTINGNTTLYAISRKKVMDINFKIQDTNAVYQSNSKVTCYSYNGKNDKCTFKAPSLTNKSGYNVVGWGKASSDSAAKSLTTSSINPGTTYNYTVSSSTSSVTYYSITSSRAECKYVIQDTSAAKFDDQYAIPVICYKYNGASSCKLTTKKLAAVNANYEVKGWNTNKNATSASVLSGRDVTITKDTTLYSITKKKSPIKINFVVTTVGASKTGGIDSCYLYNGASSCKITTPNIYMGSNKKYTPIGWNTSRNATTAKWGLGSQKTVTNSDNGKTYYSIFSAGTPVLLD